MWPSTLTPILLRPPLTLAVMLLAAVGCTGSAMLPQKTPSGTAKTARKTPSAGKPLHVKTESSGAAFDETDQEAARELLRRRVDDLVVEERFATATAWVYRFPDVAIDTLRTSLSEPAADDPALNLIASAYDSQCSGPARGGGWSDILRKRLQAPARYESYAASRRELLDQLRQGRPGEAALIPLPAAARSLEPQLRIDAAQLVATAHLLDGNNDAAIASLNEALEAAQRHCPQHAAELGLMLSDAHRRSEQYDTATQTWQQAVLAAAESLHQEIPHCDPNFWERASYLRPVDQRWPQAVEMRLAAAGGFPPAAAGQADPTDAALWASLGLWRLERDEPQPALANLKRAESMMPEGQPRATLRLAQAQALYRMDQFPAATALLVELSRSEQPQVAAPARALLGGMKLQAGDVHVGRRLLTESLKSDLAWSGRGQAEADLGLALLIAGEEEEGLRRLHEAQQRFEAEGDRESLAQSLFNESEYFKATERSKKAAEPSERMLALERSGAVLR